jgi:hypothetical protein
MFWRAIAGKWLPGEDAAPIREHIHQVSGNSGTVPAESRKKRKGEL